MIGCLIFLISLITPRLVIIGMWLFGDYLHQAYQTVLWPVLGFLFAPLTTLAYAFGQNHGGEIGGLYLVLLVLAVLVDLGLLGSGGAEARRRR
jgi:hypothetical protein